MTRPDVTAVVFANEEGAIDGCISPPCGIHYTKLACEPSH